ncbi:MAG TPA: OmpA family protein [Pedobacter sp.]|jgi:outer membrane protein OmpA-like peptidoglycan-associated protein
MITLSRLHLILFLALLFGLNGFAQIRISRIDVNKWVKDNFAGQGLILGNIKVHGNALAMGGFNSSKNVLEIQKGLILSTGLASSVAGINNKYNDSYPFGDAEKDKDLQKMVKPNLYDMSFIEFDFVPLANTLQFNYQFASEEYPEYVGSTYNDVFAFFVSDDSTTKNIAIIPEKKTPVSINTLNHLTNAEFFTDNNVFSAAVSTRSAPVVEERVRRGFFASIGHKIKGVFSKDTNSDDEGSSPTDPALVKRVKPATYRFLQFDGITKRLIAKTSVVPYKKYHLKIIIADVADNIYDSGVFVEDKSLVVTPDTSQQDFAQYARLSKLVDPKQILSGKKLEDLLPDTVYLDANIYFDTNKADILPSETKKIRGIAAIYDLINNKYIMRVAGHTDSVGNLKYNMALSRKRNQAVVTYLQQIRNIEIPIEITEDAFLKPAANNSTDQGRTKNRRVEIFFVKRD